MRNKLLGLIAEGSSFTSPIEEGYPSFEIGIAESKPEKVFFHSIYTKKMQIYFSILARYLIFADKQLRYNGIFRTTNSYLSVRNHRG